MVLSVKITKALGPVTEWIKHLVDVVSNMLKSCNASTVLISRKNKTCSAKQCASNSVFYYFVIQLDIGFTTGH